jgi:asparagine N-glycosylation enzyme membrane subunit Stt3
MIVAFRWMWNKAVWTEMVELQIISEHKNMKFSSLGFGSSWDARNVFVYIQVVHLFRVSGCITCVFFCVSFLFATFQNRFVFTLTITGPLATILCVRGPLIL